MHVMVGQVQELVRPSKVNGNRLHLTLTTYLSLCERETTGFCAVRGVCEAVLFIIILTIITTIIVIIINTISALN